MSYREMHPQFAKTFEYFLGVPPAIKEGLWRYLAYGIEPGSFCHAVLCNDFFAAIPRADSSWNGKNFKDLAKWVMFYAPRESFGSAETVEAWKALDNNTRCDIMVAGQLRPHEFDILRGIAVP